MMQQTTSQLSLRPIPFLAFAACLVALLSAGLCSARAEPLRVFVSVLPQKTFVEKVGGKQVDVHVMVRPGYSPHTYDPTPKQIAALTDATLYIRTGVPFERAWMERIRAANPDMQVLDARTGVTLQDSEPHDHSDRNRHTLEDEHGDERHQAEESDPHVWTDPRLVRQMAGRIRDELAELDPGNEQDYQSNYDAFATELDVLDRDIRSLLKDLPNRKFMVFHPAWGYFARAYGLIQVSIENEGKEPGPRALTALIEQAKREQVKVIFVQPQFSSRSADQVARAIGGRVVAVDPLSPDYADNLRKVARQIAEAGGQAR